jgi:hypothetical protein
MFTKGTPEDTLAPARQYRHTRSIARQLLDEIG